MLEPLCHRGQQQRSICTRSSICSAGGSHGRPDDRCTRLRVSRGAPRTSSLLYVVRSAQTARLPPHHPPTNNEAPSLSHARGPGLLAPCTAQAARTRPQSTQGHLLVRGDLESTSLAGARPRRRVVHRRAHHARRGASRHAPLFLVLFAPLQVAHDVGPREHVVSAEPGGCGEASAAGLRERVQDG